MPPRLQRGIILDHARLPLTRVERQFASRALDRYPGDRSSIVKTSALQTPADLAWQDAAMRPALVELRREADRSGTPAMKARSRKLPLGLERA